MDYESPKVRIIENFISTENCEFLIEESKKSDLWSIANIGVDSDIKEEHRAQFNTQWNDRVIDLHQIASLRLCPELLSLAWDVKERSRIEVENFFERTHDSIFLESWEIVRWHEPFWQQPHIDYINPDFNRETDLPADYNEMWFPPAAEEIYRIYNTQKHYTSMLYLSGDFDGGEIYFPRHNNFMIKPKPGLLVIFEGTVENPHGINPIANGVRYVNTAFWCRNVTPKYLGDAHLNGNFDKYW